MRKLFHLCPLGACAPVHQAQAHAQTHTNTDKATQRRRRTHTEDLRIEIIPGTLRCACAAASRGSMCLRICMLVLTVSDLIAGVLQLKPDIRQYILRAGPAIITRQERDRERVRITHRLVGCFGWLVGGVATTCFMGRPKRACILITNKFKQ